MKKPARPMDVSTLRLNTYLATNRIKTALKLAQELQTDPEKDARLARHFCIACYYAGRGGLAGQAFTEQPCACCHSPEMYSSTRTDALCLPCAQTHHLCKHCAGDIDMNLERAEWPTPAPQR